MLGKSDKSMGIVQGILQEELGRLEKLYEKYQQKINDLPKGSLSVKKRHHKAFVYRAYRSKDQVKFEYIGKDSSPAAAKAKEQLQERQKYIALLKKVKNDIQEIRRSLHGKK